MTGDSPQLRQRAMRCRELAGNSRDAKTQQFLLMLARDYERDADAAEGATAIARTLAQAREGD